MPSSIPFDPGLVLGQVIETTKITALKEKAEILKSKDAAENKMNQTILAKSRLSMLQKELLNMGVGKDKLADIEKKIEDLDKDLVQNALEFATKSIAAVEEESRAAENQPQNQINEEPESPIDFAASQLIQMNLSSDTMTMNVQVSLFISMVQTVARVGSKRLEK